MRAIALWFAVLSVAVIVYVFANRSSRPKQAVHEGFKEEGEDGRIYPPDIYIAPSPTKHGRGIFASRDFSEGEIIERVPTLDVSMADCDALKDYVFQHGTDENMRVVALGYLSLYNHDDDYNCDYSQDETDTHIVVRARRHIRAGEEIFVTYGDAWWTSRPQSIKL